MEPQKTQRIAEIVSVVVHFDPAATYTRKQIADLFGGMGPGVLPAKAGKVVCALFDPFENAVTHLSGEVDVYPKALPKLAKSLEHEVPAFLKVSTQFWRFIGHYKLDRVDKDKRSLEKARKEIGRDNVAAVLRFVPTKLALKVLSRE